MFEKLKKLIEEAQKKQVQSMDLSRFDHPVAQQTDWHPLKAGGTNFCTHVLNSETRNQLIYKPSKGAKIFIGVFGTVGVLGLVIPLLAFWGQDQKEWGLLLFALFFGGIFSGAAFLLYHFMATPRVFDTFYKEYYKGHKKPNDMIKDPKNPLIEFRDIAALQILREYVRSDKSSYYSYELNLVLKDGQRVNVIDHGKIQQIRDDAEILSTHIGVPVWDVA